MPHNIYVPLHNHTKRGSAFDGDIDVQKFVEYSKDLGMPGVCITDHGSMSAAFELYEACEKAGLKHLIGCELYVKESDGSKTPRGKDYYHLTAIAINLQGYKNLCKLSTIGNVEQRHGRSKKPCVHDEQIFEHQEGLVILSGCVSSKLNQCLDVGDDKGAAKWVLKYRNVFGDRFYLEMHCHKGVNKSWDTNTLKISELGRKFNIKRIITNDAHFMKREDWYSQTLTLAIGINAEVQSARLKDFTYTGEEFIKTREEIFSHFLEHSGLDAEEINLALDHTVEVADKFEYYSLKNVVSQLQFCDTPQETFEEHCLRGMHERYPGISDDDPKWARFWYEFKVISEFKFADYFLIVEDFCNFVRSIGHKVGKGRGSSAGSLIAYCLRITDIDPIKHDLLFERFLNPGRNSLPDIDTDVDGEGKVMIIDHLRKRWGMYNVACVGTITKSAAGSALADAYRIHGLPSKQATKVSKTYFEPKTVRGIPPKIKNLLADEEEFFKYYQSCESWEKRAIDDAANYLESRERQSGVHAGGVAISTELSEYVPLTWDREEGKIVTVFDKDELEKMGVIKFDILGLTGLSQEMEIERLLREQNISIPKIDELGDYPEVYESLRDGETFGVFQVSEGIPSKLLQEIGTKCFADLAAVNALNRPGPLDSKSDRVYVKNRRLGTPKIHPIVDEILAETYGIMLYQEQIMEMAKRLSGYSLAEADDLRKIIGKKKLSEMPKQESKFVGGAIAGGGASEDLANNLWIEVKASGEYSFNKSHSYAYGFQVLISAFYKQYYPTQFWASGITVKYSKFEKSAEQIAETLKFFKVKSPRFFNPKAKCWIRNNEIYLGLANIKGIGLEAAKLVEESAPYSGILDFCLRSGLGESLITKLNFLGFFGSIYPGEAFEKLFKKKTSFKTTLTNAKKKKIKLGEPLVDLEEFSEEGFRAYLQKKEFIFPAPLTEGRSLKDIVETEMELIGTVISVDPFEGLPKYESETEFFGMLLDLKPYTTKKNDQMAFLSIRKQNGEVVDVTMFADYYTAYAEDLLASKENFSPVFFRVKLGDYKGKTSRDLQWIYPLNDVVPKLKTLKEYEGLTNWYKLNQKIVCGVILDCMQVAGWGNNAFHLKVTVLESSGSIKEVYFFDPNDLDDVVTNNPVAIIINKTFGWKGKEQWNGQEIKNLLEVVPVHAETLKDAWANKRPDGGLTPVLVNDALVPCELWV